MQSRIDEQIAAFKQLLIDDLLAFNTCLAATKLDAVLANRAWTRTSHACRSNELGQEEPAGMRSSLRGLQRPPVAPRVRRCAGRNGKTARTSVVEKSEMALDSRGRVTPVWIGVRGDRRRGDGSIMRLVHVVSWSRLSDERSGSGKRNRASSGNVVPITREYPRYVEPVPDNAKLIDRRGRAYSPARISDSTASSVSSSATTT